MVQAKLFQTTKCGDFEDKAAASAKCNAGRRSRAAHAAAEKALACACVVSFDYDIPDAVTLPEVSLAEEYANFIAEDGLFRFDAEAAAGTANSFNALGAVAAKHEPAVVFDADGGMTVKVRGGDGSLDNLHPQDYDAHWITDVFVLDQDGNVVCEHTFSEPERRERRAGHAAATDELPVHICGDNLPDTATSVTPYEYCNLHGLWQGPTYKVEYETKAAAYFAKVSEDGTGAEKYYPPSAVTDTPVKHQAAVQGWRDGFRIVALGTDGKGLHPHDFDTHYIEATFATDQHGAVAVFEMLGDAVTIAASPVFTIPDGVTSLTPYEYCKLNVSAEKAIAGNGSGVCGYV